MFYGLLALGGAELVEGVKGTTPFTLKSIMSALSAALYWGAFVHVKRQGGSRPSRAR